MSQYICLFTILFRCSAILLSDDDFHISLTVVFTLTDPSKTFAAPFNSGS